MNHFVRRFPAFRIVTPGTSKRAAFKKDGRANAGAVMNRIFFDIKNYTGYAAVIHVSLRTTGTLSLPEKVFFFNEFERASD
ncbi:MAG: hypothetical protein WHS88_08730 [Anaerohalosphaeraceae bacterium]